MNLRPGDQLKRRFGPAFALLSRSNFSQTALQAIPFWFASLLVGLVAVAYTKLFGYAEAGLKGLLQWHAWILLLVTPGCFFFAWLLVQVFAPNAKGSGIPQVMAAIDLATPKHEKSLPKLLSIRIIIAKIASSLLMVLGGGAIGREGPTIQIAASVFHRVYKRLPASWAKLSDQNFIITGAAAGLAAAFNTPLGGIVFAVEELARIHVRHFRTPLFSAVIIAGLTAQGLLGPYLYLGYPSVSNPSASIFFGVAATAVLAGALGSLMCKLILKIMRWKKGFSTAQSIAYLLVAGLFMATVATFLNTAIFGSGKELMNEVLFTGDKYVPWHTVLVRFVGPIICFNTGAAGGVFAPALATGAAVGSFLGWLFHVAGTNANILVLAGMVAFLTGVTRTPFTSAILVLEMTDRHSIIFHLMLAALLSNLAAYFVDKHSFYDQLKKGYLADVLHEERNETVPEALRPV